MGSGPERSVAFLDVVCMWLSLHIMLYELVFVEGDTNFVHQQWFPPKYSQYPSWNHVCFFIVSTTVGSKATMILGWFLLCPFYAEISPTFFNLLTT